MVMAARLGAQLCFELREAGISETMLPIIVMSGHSDKDLVEQVWDGIWVGRGSGWGGDPPAPHSRAAYPPKPAPAQDPEPGNSE